MKLVWRIGSPICIAGYIEEHIGHNPREESTFRRRTDSNGRWVSRHWKTKSFNRPWLAKFGLELHADKTRLIEFGRYAARNRQRRGEGKPETFMFLGFTHFCGQLTTGPFIVWRITAKKRMVAKLKAIKAELRVPHLYPITKRLKR